MRQIIQLFLSIIILTALCVPKLYSQEKIAQTGFNFLEVNSDARSSGMGDAVNSFLGYSGALFSNPASMGNMPSFVNASFSMNKWIADIDHIQASVILSPSSGDYGVIGFSVQSVDYGDVEGTIVANNELGYVDTKVFSPTAMAVGIGYAKMLSEQFSVGAHIRYAFQELGESIVPDGDGTKIQKNETSALAYDFGTVYKLGIESLAFGMSVRNFSTEVKFEEEDFQLPLIFTIGISANLFDFINIGGPSQALLLSIDSTHPRSHPEQVKVGIEYKFMDVLSLRGGYISGNDEDDYSFGFGLNSFGIELDYAYTPFGVFDNVQRFTARYSL